MSLTTFDRIQSLTQFEPPADWIQIRTIDMHTGGEPLRVIVDGFPELPGDSVLERRRYCRDNFDHLRTALMFEPRGHADMYGCILVPPNEQSNPDDLADFGILFLHNEGYSTMCGHAIIAISKLAVEMGWVDAEEGENTIKIDAPCGPITSMVEVRNGKATQVRFHCVPSFVVGLDRKVEVPDGGPVTYDLAYGGAFYAYVDLAKNNLNLGLGKHDYRDLIQTGMQIKQAVKLQDAEIKHPFEDDLSFLYGTIFIGDSKNSNVDSRNVCIFAEGEVDRCPTGSGVSGRMAIHFAREEIQVGQSMTIESISNSQFIGSVASTTTFGGYQAVIPQVAGSAFITGMQTFVIDPNDPMKDGFLIR